MAEQFRTCSVDWCNTKPRCRGWCQLHYVRWKKYGSPEAGPTRQGEPREFAINLAKSEQKESKCITWPYSRNLDGYGIVRLANGKRTFASKFICELKYGPAPSNSHQSAHSCGNGHLGCVNPRHLRWATPMENHADKLIHGTHQRGERHPSSRLTAEQVLEIRRTNGKIKSPEAAVLYGVSESLIVRIRARETWKWLA